MRLWDTVSGKPIGDPVALKSAVKSLAYGDDGVVAAACGDSQIRLLDFSADPAPAMLDVQAPVSLVAFGDAPDELIVGGRMQDLAIWSRESKEKIRSLTFRDFPARLHRQPQGHLTAVASYRRLSAWNLTSKRSLGATTSHSANPVLAFDPRGQWLLGPGANGSMRIADSHLLSRQHGQPLRCRVGCLGGGFTADGQFFLATANHEFRMYQTGRAQETLLDVPRGVRSVALAPGGAVIGDEDGAIELRAFDDWEESVWSIQHRAGPLKLVAMQPDRGRMLSVGGPAIGLWDVSGDGEPRPVKALPHEANVSLARFSADGAWVVSTDGKQVHVWDTATGEPIKQTAALHFPLAIAAHAAERRVAVASVQGGVQLWSLDDESFSQAIDVQPGRSSLDLSRDGRSLVVAAVDQSLQTYDVETLAPLQGGLAGPGKIVQARYSPNGELIAARYEAGQGAEILRMWHVPSGQPIGGDLSLYVPSVFCFSADGGQLAMISQAKCRIVGCPQVGPLPLDRLQNWLQVSTGLDVSPAGAVRMLTCGEWQRVRSELLEVDPQAAGPAADYQPLPYPTMSHPIGSILTARPLPAPAARLAPGRQYVEQFQLDNDLNSAGRPQVSGDGATIELTSLDKPQIGSVWLREPQQLPWTLRFQYSANNRTAAEAARRGGGLVVAFGQRLYPAGSRERPTLLDGSGYALQLATDTTDPQLLLLDGKGNILEGRRIADAYTGGGWREMTLQVAAGQLIASIDGVEVLTWKGAIDEQHGGIGWVSSTARAARQHQIRGVQISTE